MAYGFSKDNNNLEKFIKYSIPFLEFVRSGVIKTLYIIIKQMIINILLKFKWVI